MYLIEKKSNKELVRFPSLQKRFFTKLRTQTTKKNQPLCNMLSGSKCPQQQSAAAWMDSSHGGSRGHAFLWEIHNTTLLHHKALRFQHTQGTCSAFMADLPTCTSPTRSEYVRINVYVHCDYVLHFPVDLALQITFKTSDPDTDKVSRYSKWLLRLTFACFLAYCPSHYPWVSLTLDIQSKDLLLSAIYKRRRRQDK